MELKSSKQRASSEQAAGFNRTFMELKLKFFTTDCEYLFIVLIVPLWNWNTGDIYGKGASFKF